MKQIKILLLSGLVVLLFIGCGGGSGSSAPDVNISEVIENKPFYRVKTADARYLIETFDGNGSLYEDTYFMNDDFDTNRTIPYEIDDPYVYIAYSDGTIRCKVEDSNLSVIFWCIKVGASGALSPTIRWKTLDDAISNPEN